MDDAYRFAMQEHLAELAEELQHIQDLLQQQDHMPTLVYRAAERNLQLLVEACIGIAKQKLKAIGKQVPSEARQTFEKLKAEGFDHSGIPWQQVVGMRNALVHDYLNLDRDRIAEVIISGKYKTLIEFADKILRQNQ